MDQAVSGSLILIVYSFINWSFLTSGFKKVFGLYYVNEYVWIKFFSNLQSANSETHDTTETGYGEVVLL